MKHTRYRIDDDHGHFAHRPRTTHSQLMPFGDQCLLHFLADTRLDAEVARIHRMRERRCRETARRPAWGFDRLLNVHVEVYDVKKRLNCAHELIVSSSAQSYTFDLLIKIRHVSIKCTAPFTSFGVLSENGAPRRGWERDVLGPAAQTIRNQHRAHAALQGKTPIENRKFNIAASVESYRWTGH